MPRLFTGLAIPPDVREHFALLRGGLPGARWIEPADYHLTLRFIGDIDDALAEDVFEELAATTGAAVEVTLTELKAFGGQRPRAIVARAEPSPALMRLQAEHERLIRNAGVAAETRKFVPHVTLARLTAGGSADAAHYLGSKTILSPIRFTAREFLVYSSRASKGGGPYVEEARYPLE